MRILQVTSHLNVGGIPRYVVSLSRALALRGHELIVASEGGPLEAELTGAGLRHARVPLKTSVEFSPQVWRATAALESLARETPVDVVHGHTRVGQVVADRLARRLRLPSVATWHGFYRRNLGRRLWPCTGDLTIAISEPVRQHLLKDFGLPEQRVRLVANGIETARFERAVAPDEQQRFRVEHRLPSGARVVGTVSRLVAAKGVDRLVQAMPAIRAAVPSAHLLIVGDGEERARLERMAAGLGLAEAVRITGQLPETRAALSLMEVFVFLPTRDEGFGLSLLEAMAAARPIVAVRGGAGAAWLLEQLQLEPVVDSDDAPALARAVVELLTNGERACAASGRVRALVKARFDIGRVAAEVEAAYQELLAR